MTTTAIRAKLHDYIRDADDKKVEALYLILENQIVPEYDWSLDKEFVAQLEEEYQDYKDGIDNGVSMEELEASIEIKENPGTRI